MASSQEEVVEEKLRMLVEKWPDSTIDELAETLEVSEETINEWVMELKKVMKAQGLSDEMISQVFPPKRKPGKVDVFEKVVKDLFVTRMKKPAKEKPVQ
jgi:DNA-binding XRE family transcriptional regulator